MRFKIIDTFGKPEYTVDTLKNVRVEASKAGAPMCYDITLADGNGVTMPVTANLAFFAGIGSRSINPSEEGDVVRRGVCKALVTNQTAVAVGDILIPADSKEHLIRSGAGNAASSGPVIALQVYATTADPTAALKTVYVKA
jgi:hypothetical protein